MVPLRKAVGNGYCHWFLIDLLNLTSAFTGVPTSYIHKLSNVLKNTYTEDITYLPSSNPNIVV